MTKILFIQSGANHQESVTREVSRCFLQRFQQQNQGEASIDVRYRDLEEVDLPLIDQGLLNAFFSKEKGNLSVTQKAQLSLSNQFIDELSWADVLVIGAPMYNFSVPARLKAWIDLICRAGLTFEYTENGPRGLLNISKAYLVVATGGTPVESEMDFASGYLKQIARFIGVDHAEVIHADGSKGKRDEIIGRASKQIDQLLAA